MKRLEFADTNELKQHLVDCGVWGEDLVLRDRKWWGLLEGKWDASHPLQIHVICNGPSHGGFLWDDKRKCHVANFQPEGYGRRVRLIHNLFRNTNVSVTA